MSFTNRDVVAQAINWSNQGQRVVLGVCRHGLTGLSNHFGDGVVGFSLGLAFYAAFNWRGICLGFFGG